MAVAQTLDQLLATPTRDFLIDNTGKEVKISSLVGKVVGIFFSAQWCPPCNKFTPKLAAVYAQLAGDTARPFELVLASADTDDAEFKEYHKSIAWLAIPYSDRAVQRALEDKFKVRGIPTLVLLDETGATISMSAGAQVVREGATGYPWKPLAVRPSSVTSSAAPEPRTEIKEVKVVEKESKFISMLVTPERDYLVDAKGTQHPVARLKGKIVAFYFSASWCGPCRNFTPVLKQLYAQLKALNKPFEVVLISHDKDASGWQSYLNEMPWLSLPFADRSTAYALNEKFEVPGIPYVVIFDEDGDELSRDGRALLQRTGAAGYPYKPDPEVLRRKKEAEAKAQIDFDLQLRQIFAHLDVNRDSKVTRSEVIQRIREGRVVSEAQVNKAADDIMRDVDSVRVAGAGRGESHFSLTDWLTYFESVVKLNGGLWPLTHLAQLVGAPRVAAKRAAATYDAIDPVYD